MQPPLPHRIRWRNVVRAVLVLAAVALVVAWPRLRAPAPVVPEAPPAVADPVGRPSTQTLPAPRAPASRRRPRARPPVRRARPARAPRAATPAAAPRPTAVAPPAPTAEFEPSP